ncbi:unnamed protein product [Hermetia illucens]|uniref:Uncharacterized protein n=1 Tax=Hermetia illucens TaxID=343691 RepID=A0A7R8YQN0_HERIL|nr:unnamed protein product [Hermetia illucens]
MQHTKSYLVLCLDIGLISKFFFWFCNPKFPCCKRPSTASKPNWSDLGINCEPACLCLDCAKKDLVHGAMPRGKKRSTFDVNPSSEERLSKRQRSSYSRS